MAICQTLYIYVVHIFWKNIEQIFMRFLQKEINEIKITVFL